MKLNTVLALSSLVAKSLDNDILGHVQKDIPRVLEALVLLLIELEKLQTEALATYGVKKPNSQVRVHLHLLFHRCSASF